MRPAIILTLLALAVLPTFLTGCGNSNLPDTLVVTQYYLAPGTQTPSVPFDPVLHDPYDVAAPQYVIQRWQNTDTSLVRRLYNEVIHYSTDPDGHNGPNICFSYWYQIAFQQGGHTLAFVRLSECPIRGVVLNDQRRILPGADFLHIIMIDMKIPIAW